MSKRVEIYTALIMAKGIAWEHKMYDIENEIDAIMKKIKAKFNISDYDELIKHTGNIQAKIFYAKSKKKLKQGIKTFLNKPL